MSVRLVFRYSDPSMGWGQELERERMSVRLVFRYSDPSMS